MKVPEHVQSPSEVPLSKVPNPHMLIYCRVLQWTNNSSRGGPAFVNCVPSLWKGQSTLEDEDTVEYVMGQNWRGMFRA